MQFNRGTSAMQHYVASRPMFIDVEVMNEDIQVVLGDQGLQSSTTQIARGLSTLYKGMAGMKRIPYFVSHVKEVYVPFSCVLCCKRSDVIVAFFFSWGLVT